MATNMGEAVGGLYGATARGAAGIDRAAADRVAAAFGYSADELAAVPEGANLGLSCGNPTATAKLRPGETVVDLGSGGGFDVFLAARAVGADGRAIGIDMSPDMLSLARRNAEKAGVRNAEFRLGGIEALPLPDASADCVISNCVINLSEDKAAVFREIARVLKPGGRVAISDIALKQTLPAPLKESVAAYVGCIAGAIPASAFVEGLTAAGLRDVLVVKDGTDLNAYGEVDGQAACCAPAAAEVQSSCCGPSSAAQPEDAHAALRQILSSYDLNDYAGSVKVYAVKPA
ncbi:SAM-dependent methyltransferase [Pacificimonas flava]|uniref:Arsenite methyltransferase n=2 Tax=Pacificimonas TaxID=1960290 RepID=A0A219B4F1_9SPHN|nr:MULTISPECIES: arsenite methyltransferase [Pacificimonas]MBZ6377275.1 arsenite methyltransferase [Pacificimonas aurantium]OWV33013.1 SAM-dependent methyltransferase [Pacificimonas flava]